MAPAITKRPSMVFPNPAGLTDGSRCVVQGQEGGTTTGTAPKSQSTPEGCQNHRRSSRSLKRPPSGTPPGCGFLASWHRWSAHSPLPTHRLLSCNPPGCGTGGGAPVTPGLTHQKCFAKEQKVVGNDKVCDPQQLRPAERFHVSKRIAIRGLLRLIEPRSL